MLKLAATKFSMLDPENSVKLVELRPVKDVVPLVWIAMLNALPVLAKVRDPVEEIRSLVLPCRFQL